MIKTAADLLQRNVITIRASATLAELGMLMDEEGIHGVPVLNSAGDPIGVVSRSDLASAITDGSGVLAPTQHSYAVADDDIDLDEIDNGNGYGGEKTVADIMSSRIVKATVKATAGSLARIMSSQKINRILITDGGKLVGIVSSTDVLKCMPEYERLLAKQALAKAGTRSASKDKPAGSKTSGKSASKKDVGKKAAKKKAARKKAQGKKSRSGKRS